MHSTRLPSGSAISFSNDGTYFLAEQGKNVNYT